MSGVAFVGEGGEEREVVGEVPVVDVDYIGSLGIHRRSQIKGQGSGIFSWRDEPGGLHRRSS